MSKNVDFKVHQLFLLLLQNVKALRPKEGLSNCFKRSGQGTIKKGVRLFAFQAILPVSIEISMLTNKVQFYTVPIAIKRTPVESKIAYEYKIIIDEWWLRNLSRIAKTSLQ